MPCCSTVTVNGEPVHELTCPKFAHLPIAQKGRPMKTFILYWSPEGRPIARVQARGMRAAIRKAPYPYRRYLGEIYAIEVVRS